MAELIRDFDWSKTSVGPRESWPAHLRTAVSLALGSGFVTGILWGRERIQIYNDAYARLLAEKHPAALGERASVTWKPLWDVADPLMSAVERGEAVLLTDQRMPMERHGRIEEAYFTFSYNPLFSDSGEVDGIFITALETTDVVLSNRREKTLQRMADAVTGDCSLEEALKRSAAPIAENASDVPFAGIYLCEHLKDARLLWAHEAIQHDVALPQTLQFDDSGNDPLARAFAESLTHERPVRHTLRGREILLFPFGDPGGFERCGVLLVGFSPWLPLDAAYESFFRRASEQLGATLIRASELHRLRSERISVLERMTDGFYALDPEWRVTYVNVACERYIGKSRQEMLGRKFWEIVPSLRGGELHRRFEEAMRTQQFVEFELEGSARRQLSRVRVHPSPQGLSVFFQDVSTEREALQQRERMERNLKESEQRYRTLFENSPLPMWLYDRQTLKFLEVNQAAVDRYGYSREEFRTMTLRDIRPPEELPKLAAFLKLSTDMRSQGEVFLHRYKDGSLHPVEISSHALQLPGGKAQLVVANDISEKVNAEARAREAHRLTAAVIENAPVAIFTCDPSLRVLSWNPAAERLFGWSAEEVVGKPLPIIPDEEAEHVREIARQEFATGVPLEGWEVRRKRRDGKILHVLLSTALLRDGEGRVNGLVAFTIDLSERKALEEQFRQAQKMEAVGQLAGGIAHDFNNLLAVILTNLRITARELPPGSEGLECLQDAEGAAERAAVLTRQLLNFSRRESLEIEPLRFDDVIRETERLLRPLIRSDISLETRTNAPAECVRADRGQLEQVLVNLVVNARDAMPHGGSLLLETSVRELPELIGSLEPGRYVQLRVTDTGEGMDALTRERIFEPFFTTKPVGQGTGLGLATVYGFISQWGGSISVESAPGKGTTFTVLLPVDCEAPRPAPASPNELEAPGGTELVLVVEDDRLVRAAMRRQLVRYGYRVLEASDGLEALHLVQERGEEIALVLSDLVMPRMGGRALALRLREEAPALRVLLMSAYDREGVESGIEGLEDVDLRKPFHPMTLLQKIRETLDAPPAPKRGA